MSFDQAAVLSLFSAIVSDAEQLGIFETVNQHEPKSPIPGGTHAAIWVQSILPVPGASGLSATSAVITFNIRIYKNFLQMPLDGIDPDILTAASTLMNAFTGGFTLGTTVRNIDLLGMYGQPMGATAGYIDNGGKVYRIMTVTVPVVVNDLWSHNV